MDRAPAGIAAKKEKTAPQRAQMGTPEEAGMSGSLAYIGLGSNLGDSVAQVNFALEAIDTSACSVTARSSLYSSAPVGYLEQPHFVNAVCAVRTGLDPGELLDWMLDTESAMGRKRPAPANRPRLIDLDLLLYDDLTVSTSALSIPHPRMHERRFVLQPLSEIDSGLEIPGRGALASLLANCADQEVFRID